MPRVSAERAFVRPNAGVVVRRRTAEPLDENRLRQVRAVAASGAGPHVASYHMARPFATPDGPRPFPFTCCTLRRHP